MPERRLPTPEEAAAQIRRGVIDDTLAASSPFDFEDWELCGEPQPPEQEQGGRPTSQAPRTRK